MRGAFDKDDKLGHADSDRRVNVRKRTIRKLVKVEMHVTDSRQRAIVLTALDKSRACSDSRSDITQLFFKFDFDAFFAVLSVSIFKYSDLLEIK